MTSSKNNNSNSDTPLLQRSEVISTFIHQEVLVGVNQTTNNNNKNSSDVVAIKGRLDAVDNFCNVTLGNATSPALLGGSEDVSKVASIKGANVAFFGIPKKN